MSANRDVDAHPSLLPSGAPRTIRFSISGSVLVLGFAGCCKIRRKVVVYIQEIGG